MITYRQQRKDWKSEWREEKRKKKSSGELVTPFRDWMNVKIDNLAANDPEGFKQYCDSYERTQKIKSGIILGAGVVIGVACFGAILDMALYYGLASVEATSGAVMFGGIIGATGVGTWLARRKYSALQRLKRLFGRRGNRPSDKGWNLTDEEKIEREPQRQAKISRFRKRTRLPKVMLDYFETGKVQASSKLDDTAQADKDKAEPKVITHNLEEDKTTKRETRKEWYSEELEKSDKIKVSVYGNKKSDRPDKWGLLGVFDTDNVKNALDATNIQGILGGCPKSVVESLNPELLIGARVNDDGKKIRSDSSYTHVNKDELHSDSEGTRTL